MRWALLIVGIVLLIGGFGYDIAYVNMPYQDPTPEMEARWSRDRGVAETLMMAGAVILVVGIITGVSTIWWDRRKQER